MVGGSALQGVRERLDIFLEICLLLENLESDGWYWFGWLVDFKYG